VAVPKDARKLRIARWAEGAYALSALLVVASLPSPSSRNVTEWVHWLGTAILAGLLVVKLRRPNHAVWWVAAFLAAWVLGVALFSASGAVTGRRAFALPTAPLALLILVVLLGSQAVVVACLTGLRHLARTRS
jgi:hypothetical protein